MKSPRGGPETIELKVVYYGPSLGGKTANLVSLQALSANAGDPSQFLSLDATDERTLFFDLLSIEPGPILGHPLRIRIYSVPGQVRHDAARKVVLSGVDALVFVVDSRIGREEQNRWSHQNLQMNLRAARLTGAGIPVVYQFNKQDLDEAAAPSEVARWLKLEPRVGIPAVATAHVGVPETLREAVGAALRRSPEIGRAVASDATAGDRLEADLDRALEPLHRRRESIVGAGTVAGQAESGRTSITLSGADPDQTAIRTALRLGERLLRETAARSHDASARGSRSHPGRDVEPDRERWSALRRTAEEVLEASIELRETRPRGRNRAARIRALVERVEHVRELVAALDPSEVSDGEEPAVRTPRLAGTAT